jgi:TPR repeat protein
MAQDDNRATSAQSEISQPARSSKGEAVAMVQPGEPGAQVPPASKATRVLDPEEIKLALGATYDPIALANLGVAGLGANVEKARIWYQKAESLGSTEATRRLAVLANR